MRFVHPEYLKLFALILLLFPASLYSLCLRLRARARLGGQKLGLTSRPSRIYGHVLKLAAVHAVLVCLILALARPQVIAEKRAPELRAMGVVFLLDTSPSMLARDIPPSRLERASEVIAKFIGNKLPEDRFGLVSFSQNSLILSYLTSDPNNILFYLDYLRERTSPMLGTNIGGALRSGLGVANRQREVEPRGEESKKVFILISDGEDHGKELDMALQEVAQLSVRVFCIGIGSRRGAFIPIPGERGEASYLKDGKGQFVVATFDEGTLRHIAHATGGIYYRVFTGKELEDIFAEIFLKSREIQSFKRVREARELYHYFLMGAFGIFVLRILI